MKWGGSPTSTGDGADLESPFLAPSQTASVSQHRWAAWTPCQPAVVPQRNCCRCRRCCCCCCYDLQSYMPLRQGSFQSRGTTCMAVNSKYDQPPSMLALQCYLLLSSTDCEQLRT